jgi:hypothetical protein
MIDSHRCSTRSAAQARACPRISEWSSVTTDSSMMLLHNIGSPTIYVLRTLEAGVFPASRDAPAKRARPFSDACLSRENPRYILCVAVAVLITPHYERNKERRLSINDAASLSALAISHQSRSISSNMRVPQPVRSSESILSQSLLSIRYMEC